jgi:hypothetical protein
MATWKAITLVDAISNVTNNIFVLPVIQRRLVWDTDKMELLFDTLLKGDSFGGIMVLKEDKNTRPLFAFRYFTKDGSNIGSISVNSLEQDIYLIIDGQQRLQSFYIGLSGTFEGKQLYFNLLSDYKNLDFDFRFASKQDELKDKSKDDEGNEFRNEWISAISLFNKLKDTYDADQISDEIIMSKNINDENEKAKIRKNILAFYNNIFSTPSIGISSVNVNKSFDETFNRQRIVEEFRRLNDGGTRLSGYDLVASILKGYNWEMEKFLDDILKNYSDINISQDFIIKLIFLLQDDYKKEMANIEAQDANFAITNKERIIVCFEVLKKYLQYSQLDNYYKNSNRSDIPLYFVLYHTFHKPLGIPELEKVYDNYEINNSDFRAITRWFYISLLNGVFKSKGVGWIPYKTGIKKILLELKKHKGRIFPTEKIFEIYKKHPLRFFLEIINEFFIQLYDDSFVFYLIYDRKIPVRIQDVDHIHPSSLLERANIEFNIINTIVNYQLLDSGTNRYEKNGKPLNEWITNNVENKVLYLEKHLIPSDENLWDLTNYQSFLDARRKLILSKIENIISNYA